MTVRKLNTTDAFVVVDLPDAPASGIVRCARKILQGGASDLARSASYTFAVFGMERSGASAGINAQGDAVPDAISAFVAELADQEPALVLDEGKGVHNDQLGPLSSGIDGTLLTVSGVMAAAAHVLGGIDGKSFAIEGTGTVPTALQSAVTDAGGSIVEVEGVKEKPWLIWGAPADAVLTGSKAGVLTHQGTEFVKAKAIVPWAPIPVTTKAFAQLRRADVEVVPDFVSAAGALLGGASADAADPVAIATLVTSVLEDVSQHCDGLLLGACERAESFLASWTDQRLFGRPLAA